MPHHGHNGHTMGALHTPVRNHYFFGKLLDTRHFTLEQSYFNGKRALLNRLVTGYGVVCGLNLVLTDDREHVVVLPGFALDKWGRDITVTSPSKPIRCERLPDAPIGEEEWIHLCLEYHECQSDPAPVLTAACDDSGPCAADTIRERYKISARPGRVPEPEHECTIPEAVSSQTIRKDLLAIAVSEMCERPPSDSCIPLGEIMVPETGPCDPADVHVEHRPIVYSNDLLFELILGLCEELRGRRGK